MIDWQNASTWSVLLVDDEPDNIEVVADTLVFFGMTVRTAVNGLEALEIMHTFLPDVILLDLSMPRMDGWTARSAIKSDPRTRHIPVIALSAHAMAGDKERALEAGFDGYMTKPVSVPTLVEDLRTLVAPKKPEEVWE